LTEEILSQLAVIFGLGVAAQWIAWKLRLPSILILLIFGLAAGPLAYAWGLHESIGHFIFPIDPDRLFGELLFPIVSLSVAVILFEGGLTLKFSELKGVGRTTLRMIVIGVPITWLLTTLAAHFVLGLSLSISILFGAILVVTGPTVIMPLLRHIRPVGRVGSVIKWEGIVNDPIGAILAVLVFEALLAGSVSEITFGALWGTIKALSIGGALGLLGAAMLVLLFKKFLVPDYLENPVALAFVVGTFTFSNYFQPESGLLTVTIMGIILANQPFANIKHIVEFKETLRVLLISVLFIVLAARIAPDDLRVLLDLNSLIFLAVMILLVRPISVGLATIKSRLSIKERSFLAWMAPRGIVAAAVTSLFALKLIETGAYPDADKLVPYIFLVIIGTVAIYGLTAAPIALRLGLATPNPQGVLFVSANMWARKIAKAIHEEGIPVLMVDSNWNNLSQARMEGLNTHYANILSESTLEELDLGGIGRLLALTANDEINALAALHFSEIFGRKEVYQLSIGPQSESIPPHLYGRFLFGEGATYSRLNRRFRSGFEVKKTPITDEFTFDDYRAEHGESAIPLFVLNRQTGTLVVLTADEAANPKPDDILIGLVKGFNSHEV